MNFQYEIAQNSVTMSVKKFTELQTFAHKNESDQALTLTAITVHVAKKLYFFQDSSLSYALYLREVVL